MNKSSFSRSRSSINSSRSSARPQDKVVRFASEAGEVQHEPEDKGLKKIGRGWGGREKLGRKKLSSETASGEKQVQIKPKKGVRKPVSSQTPSRYPRITKGFRNPPEAARMPLVFGEQPPVTLDLAELSARPIRWNSISQEGPTIVYPAEIDLGGDVSVQPTEMCKTLLTLLGSPDMCGPVNAFFEQRPLTEHLFAKSLIDFVLNAEDLEEVRQAEFLLTTFFPTDAALERMLQSHFGDRSSDLRAFVSGEAIVQARTLLKRAREAQSAHDEMGLADSMGSFRELIQTTVFAELGSVVRDVYLEFLEAKRNGTLPVVASD